MHSALPSWSAGLLPRCAPGGARSNLEKRGYLHPNPAKKRAQALKHKTYNKINPTELKRA
jgi:hypothetical protein